MRKKINFIFIFILISIFNIGILYSESMNLNEMVHISGGTFSNGTNNFTVSSYSIGKYEVTYIVWKEIYDWGAANGYIFANSGKKGDNGNRTNNDPVTYVSWYDVIAWCNAKSEKEGYKPCYYNPGQSHIPANVYRGSVNGNEIDIEDVEWNADGYRLPTDSEWEFAARGGKMSRNFTYSGSNEADEVGWYDINSGGSTHPVGEKKANELGIYDMSGNVYEWCWDWDGIIPVNDLKDFKGPKKGTWRIKRNGSWFYNVYNCTVSFRSVYLPYNSSAFLGFRVVRRSN